MRLAFPWIALLAGFAFAGAVEASPASDPLPLAGARIVLRIEEGAAGLSGHVDSPDEGLENLPAEDLRIDGSRLSFELRLAGARFEGQVVAGGSRIEGRWIDRAGELPLTPKTGIYPGGDEAQSALCIQFYRFDVDTGEA